MRFRSVKAEDEGTEKERERSRGEEAAWEDGFWHREHVGAVGEDECSLPSVRLSGAARRVVSASSASALPWRSFMSFLPLYRFVLVVRSATSWTHTPTIDTSRTILIASWSVKSLRTFLRTIELREGKKKVPSAYD